MRAANEKNGQNVPFDQSSHSHGKDFCSFFAIKSNIYISLIIEYFNNIFMILPVSDVTSLT